MSAVTKRPPVEETSVCLADGRCVGIRELLPSDAPALVAALEAADPDDLRRRFMGCPPPAAYLVRRLELADGVTHLGLGAFSEGGQLVGVAQFDRSGDEPSAEIAVAVDHNWQTVGLGTALITRLAQVARSRGVHHFTATFFADNLPLRRLLREVEPLVTTTYAAGEGFADLDLDST